MTPIVCSRCKKDGHVPFTPTPGRPILCGDCHRKSQARPRYGAPLPDHLRAPPPKRALNMKRKGHFVYDALEVIGDESELDASNRRAFVEMVFARGSRQTTADAITFIEEKAQEGTLTDADAEALANVVRRYAKRQ